MTEPTIPPALTPEEWKAQGDWSGTRITPGLWLERLPDGSTKLVLPDVEDIGDDAPKADAYVTLDERALLRLAALALHGQPFGFEPGDEGLIEHAALTMEAYDSTEREIANELRAIARKIAALLPPQP